MQLALSSTTQSHAEISRLGEDQLADRFRGIPGVAIVNVNGALRRELSVLLHAEKLREFSVSVTEVRMTPDLRNANAYVKPLLGEDEAIVLKALRTNTAFFQREVAKRLGLKFAPKLQFKPDESFDEAERIERLLNDPKVVRDLEDE